MPQGSPFWQGIILCAALLILLWETWRGWRRGVIRSGLHLASMTLSVVVGFAAAQVAAAPLGGFGEIGGLISGVAVGFGVGFAVFLALWLLSAVLFKRTDQQSSGILKFFWGVGGAFFGFIFGLLILWGGISLIRATGTMAEARLESQKNVVVLPAKSSNSPRPAAGGNLTSGLIVLKESLELGPAGKVASAVDPISPDFYEILFMATQVTSDQTALLRFMEYPGIQKIIENPKMAELLGNSELIRAAETKNLGSILNNKAVLNAAQDPALVKELEALDFRAALKFALEKPTPSPSPSPSATKKN